jgi:cell wall-associated NlpC family hydrolase
LPPTYKKEKGSLATSTTIGLMNTKTKYLALVSTTLLLVGFAGPANAAPKTEAPPRIVETAEPISQPTIVAVPASLNFESPVVMSVAAPLPEPEPVVQPTQVVQTYTATPTPAVQRSATPQAVSQPQPTVASVQAPVAPVAAVPASGKGAALLASAYGQVGVIQDCTAMVENALGSIGIHTGDLAPAQFFQFGTVVGDPQPGDIIISAGHVGIYAGSGQMVSGGFNGNQTVVHPISYVGGYSAVRVA